MSRPSRPSRRSAPMLALPLAMAMIPFASAVQAQSLPSNADLTRDFASGVYGSGDLMTAVGNVLQASSWLQTSQASAISGANNGSSQLSCPQGGNVSYGWTRTGQQTNFTLQFNQCAMTTRNVLTGSFVQLTQYSAPSTVCSSRTLSSCTVTATQTATNTFNGITSTMPYGAVALNGSATTKDTTVTSAAGGGTTTETTELTIPKGQNLGWTTSYVFSDRSGSLSFTDTDLTRILVSSGGTKVSSSLTGHGTVVIDPYQHTAFNLPLTFKGATQYDSTGAATSGQVSATLSPYTATLTVVPYSATVCVTPVPDGSPGDGCFGIDWSTWTGSTH